MALKGITFHFVVLLSIFSLLTFNYFLDLDCFMSSKEEPHFREFRGSIRNAREDFGEVT